MDGQPPSLGWSFIIEIHQKEVYYRFKFGTWT